MAEYRSMYLRLFNAITDATCLLQKAQAEVEGMYLAQKDPEIVVLGHPDEEQ